MARRNKPYLPLYIQDFMTDEKLIECSASATGVYIRIMCLMHKSDEYGRILLKQKHKQTSKQINNFSLLLAKTMPYDLHTIESALIELVEEGVLQINGDYLDQKRMISDCKLSETRAKPGREGGLKSAENRTKFAIAKIQANSDNDNDNDIDNDIDNNNNKGSKFKKPTIEQVRQYFKEKGYSEKAGEKAFEFYDTAGWKDSHGKQVRNWKQKMIGVWFKEENKDEIKNKNTFAGLQIPPQ